MSEEEMQRKMEFIVNQQAQFAVDIQQLREAQNELTTKHSKLSDAVLTVVGIVGKLSKSQDRTDAQIKELVAAQDRTETRMNELAQSQAATDDRLNIFINVVERYISRNGGNGSAQEN
jgi:peptidoglycan hydrolase CwlO-like protein